MRASKSRRSMEDPRLVRSGPGAPATARSAASAPYKDDDGREEDRRLGQRLRMLRRERKLSVQTLAEAAALSAGMVSQIERGLSTPSLRSLRLLGIALGVPISWFFATPDHPTPSGSPYIVHRDDRRLLRLTSTGVMKELLSPDTDGRRMEMYELTIEAGGSSGVDFYNHEGEKAGVVVAGSLRLWLRDELFTLEEGDSFQFPSLIPHRFENPGKHLTRILWINSPPTPKSTPSEVKKLAGPDN
ncbi:MAG TPA: XRE family transcriptional regulator [Bradyrhizobium sp.]|nr:XRE family transcriptional regulator [Bradyrhizobium sp.]